MLTEPVTLTLLDGRTVEMRPSMGLIYRIMKRAGVRSLQQLVEMQGEFAIGIALYEALPQEMRSTLAEEEFYELLPADVPMLARTVARLLGVDPDRPMAEALRAAPQT